MKKTAKKKENNHWYLSLDKFLEIQNEFTDEKFLLPFTGARIELESKSGIRPVTDEDKIASVRTTLGWILRDHPPKFTDYVCKGESVDEMSYGELMDAVTRYKHFHDLQILFSHFHHWLRLEETLENFTIDGRTYELPSTDIFTVRRTKRTGGKIETIVSKESIKNDIFDGLNLNRLKRCERCFNYFYAKKDDERIRFCSVKCGNAAHQENFQRSKK
jgi:hypothetical protein